MMPVHPTIPYDQEQVFASWSLDGYNVEGQLMVPSRLGWPDVADRFADELVETYIEELPVEEAPDEFYIHSLTGEVFKFKVEVDWEPTFHVTLED